MPEGLEGDKRGYLLENFRLFRLKDTSTRTLEYHYHEFDKLILLLGGKVTYMVEGVTYFLLRGICCWCPATRFTGR